MTDFALTIYRGDGRELEVTLTGVDLPLTGEEDLWFTAKATTDDADSAAAFQKRMGDGITVKDAAAGTCTVKIDAADTDTISKITTLLCDVQLVTSSDPLTLASGTILVRPDVTRSIA